MHFTEVRQGQLYKSFQSVSSIFTGHQLMKRHDHTMNTAETSPSRHQEASNRYKQAVKAAAPTKT